jgi:hypothetical protein
MGITKRGKRVRAFSIVLGVALVYMLATHIHYTEKGYCWGSFSQCYTLEGEGKR